MKKLVSFVVVIVAMSLAAFAQDPADVVLSALAAKDEQLAGRTLRNLVAIGDYARLDRIQEKAPQVFDSAMLTEDFLLGLGMNYAKAAAGALREVLVGKASANPHPAKSWQWYVFETEKAAGAVAAAKDAAAKKTAAAQLEAAQKELVALLSRGDVEGDDSARVAGYLESRGVDLSKSPIPADEMEYLRVQTKEMKDAVLAYVFKAGLPLPRKLPASVAIDDWKLLVDLYRVFYRATGLESRTEFETAAEFEERQKLWMERVDALLTLDIVLPVVLELGDYDLERGRFPLGIAFPFFEDPEDYRGIVSLRGLSFVELHYAIDRKNAAFFKEKVFPAWTASATLAASKAGSYELKELRVLNGKDPVVQGLAAYSLRIVSVDEGPALAYAENHLKDQVLFVNGAKLVGPGYAIVRLSSSGGIELRRGSAQGELLFSGDLEAYTHNPLSRNPVAKDRSGGFKLGLVTDIGGIDDKSFNQSTWEGIMRFAAENKLVEGEDVKYLQSSAEADYVPNLSTFADQKLDLIVAPGFLFNQAMAEVATRYPNQKFVIIDSVVQDRDGRNIPNVANAVFAEHEGSFLVGVAAGLRARADGESILGFVGGMKFPLIEKFQAGFEAGVRAVHPGARVLVDYAGDFGAPDKGQAIAKKQYNAGAYIIFHAAGGTGNGMIKEARERTMRGDIRWAIGVDKDQFADGLYGEGRSVVLTSMLKRVDVAAHDLAVWTKEGQFPGGEVLVFGVKQGGVGIPDINPNLSAGIVLEVRDFAERIAAGEIEVPETPHK